MTDRYIKNVKSVRIISKIFGLKLSSFDPNWCLTDDDKRPKSGLETISLSMLSNYHIPDDFMGKVAILMGLPWEFDTSTERLEDLLDEFTESLNNIGKNRPKLPLIPEIDAIQEMTDDLDRQAREQTQEQINKIGHILKIRKELCNYKKE